jgi:hypothetical protein
MMKYLNLYRIILKTFGFKLRPIGTFGLLQLHRLINGSTRGLDYLLYPDFRQIPIDRPVFILGNPRGGTTFVHRFLLNTGQLCAFELWEMLLPAISARKAFGRIIDRFVSLSPARYHGSEAHETSLRDVETDDAMAFFHFMDGGFLWSYFLAWDDVWGSDKCMSFFDLEEEPEAKKNRWFGYLEECWRRNMYFKKKNRIIVKSSTFTLRAETLLKRYPDCKLIYVIRDPVQTIPSGMSLLTGVLEQGYDVFNATDPQRRERYLENLYQASCHMYRSFYDLKMNNAIPPENLRIITYPRLMTDFEETMNELVEFLEITPDPSFYETVKEQAEKQRDYKSSHAYTLEKWGLEEDRIRSDLAYVYEGYGL